MDYILRKIKRAKWRPLESRNEPGADAISACLRTQGNALSVWACTEDAADYTQAALAIALTMDHVEDVDVVLLRTEDVRGLGCAVDQTLGETPIEDLKLRHRDIARLTLSDIHALARHIGERNGDTKYWVRVREKQIVAAAKDAVDAGRVTLDDLKPRMQERLKDLAK